MMTTKNYFGKLYRTWSVAAMITAYVMVVVSVIYMGLIGDITITTQMYQEHVAEIIIMLFFVPGIFMIAAGYLKGVWYA
jgi:hypothetical protein